VDQLLRIAVAPGWLGALAAILDVAHRTAYCRDRLDVFWGKGRIQELVFMARIVFASEIAKYDTKTEEISG
jgi:hypothetical protein